MLSFRSSLRNPCQIVIAMLAICRVVVAGFKSLFQKSPLKNRAVDGATIYDMKHAINT